MAAIANSATASSLRNIDDMVLLVLMLSLVAAALAERRIGKLGKTARKRKVEGLFRPKVGAGSRFRQDCTNNHAAVV